MRTRLLCHGALVLFLLLPFVPTVKAQTTTPDPVVILMDQMSAEAKVGQLVLVAFPGTDVGDGSEIAALIRDYGIGGVFLRPQNGNFGTSMAAPSEVLSLTMQLQQVAWDAWQTQMALIPTEPDTLSASPYIPLFVAASATLDGIPVTSFISDTTFMPSPMALGATWNPALVEMAGNVLGAELSALGINLYLGPNLDVSYTPRPGDVSDLGVNTFGGDPFWVGELGKAYVQGLHRGSEGRLLVVPRHLPGLGGADRSLEAEVPTVQKTLEQLRQIELAPFFAVARGAMGDDNVVDGFLVTHIRYRGFQGNIRQATRPISLDAQALQSVMNLPEFAPWRQAGGVLVSDNLGLKSIHYSYDPRGLSFNVRRVAQDALTAGNDVLLLNRFAADSENWQAHFANVRDTLSYLASRYKAEATFRAIVDAAVYRILSMKMRAYGEFTWDNVRLDPARLAIFATEHSVDDEVAVNALTRLVPLSSDVTAPTFQEGDTIVIFTQERYAQPFADYQPFPLLQANALRDVVLRLYGPNGTDIVSSAAVQYFTFDQLQKALTTGQEITLTEGPPSISTVVLNAIASARWVVFATTGLQSGDPNSYALKTFLAKYAHNVTGNIVVLAFGPPYELDSTEISKLDYFYVLYSSGAAFVDAGVRALFGDLVASGASPVDISALNYSLARQTMPAPNQLISLDIIGATGEVLTETARSEILKGDVLNLRTDVIIDHNGRPVPDGTPVQFVLSYPQEDIERIVVSESHGGVATTSIVLDREGQLDITAQSEPAINSVRLQLTIRAEGPIEITAIEPTPTPTPTPTPMPTATPEPTPTPTPLPLKTPRLPDPLYVPVVQGVMLLQWGIGGALLVALAGFLWARQRGLSIFIAVRVALVGLVAGLFGYVVAVAVGRFWLSGWLYSVVGREYVAVAVTMLIGVIAVIPAMLFYMAQSRHRRYVEEDR
ncbi:MAG: glycoside hydrolase family 3 N-terminal domain-containing protein [Anaerolineae bacterium]